MLVRLAPRPTDRETWSYPGSLGPARASRFDFSLQLRIVVCLYGSFASAGGTATTGPWKRLRQQQVTRPCCCPAAQPATTAAHVACSSQNQAPSPWNQHWQQSDRRPEEVFGISQDLAYPMRDCRCGLQSRRVESGPLWTVAFIVFNVVGFKKRHLTRAQNAACIVQKGKHSRNWQVDSLKVPECEPPVPSDAVQKSVRSQSHLTGDGTLSVSLSSPSRSCPRQCSRPQVHSGMSSPIPAAWRPHFEHVSSPGPTTRRMATTRMEWPKSRRPPIWNRQSFSIHQSPPTKSV